MEDSFFHVFARVSASSLLAFSLLAVTPGTVLLNSLRALPALICVHVGSVTRSGSAFCAAVVVWLNLRRFLPASICFFAEEVEVFLLLLPELDGFFVLPPSLIRMGMALIGMV